MSLQRTRQRQRAVLRTLARQVRRLITLHGVPVTDDQRATVAVAVLPHMQRARSQSFRIGAEDLVEQARDAGITPPPLAEMRRYDRTALERLLADAARVDDPGPQVQVSGPEPPERAPKVTVRVLDPEVCRARNVTVEVTDSNRRDPRVVKVVADRAVAAAERHARMPAREAITDSIEQANARAAAAVDGDFESERDRVLAGLRAIRERREQAEEAAREHADSLPEERKRLTAEQIAQRDARARAETPQPSSDGEELPEDLVGWARVLTGMESCPWCAMLASRGPVYLSAEAAGAVTERSSRFDPRDPVLYHDHCDCEVVMVVHGKPWRGEAEYEALEELWLNSTQQTSGKASVAAFSKAYRAQKKAAAAE